MASSSTGAAVELNTTDAHHRFPAWISLSVFSAVCLAALQSQRNKEDGEETWAVSVILISVLLSFIAVCFYLCHRELFVGEFPETIAVLLLVGFWAGGLPTIMNPSNNIAVSTASGIFAPFVQNANLYFFSWLSFGATVLLAASLAQEKSGVDLAGETIRKPKVALWYGLMASSLVVMGTAVRALRSSNCDLNDDNEYCRRSKFAISMGVIGFFIAGCLAWATLRTAGVMPLLGEAFFTAVQVALWSFGVGYVTFGDAPGSSIGNLYFSTWICFILSVFLFGRTVRNYLTARAGGTAEPPSETEGEIEGTTVPEIPADEEEGDVI
jgi:uncharacterized membrane protein YczE